MEIWLWVLHCDYMSHRQISEILSKKGKVRSVIEP